MSGEKRSEGKKILERKERNGGEKMSNGKATEQKVVGRTRTYTYSYL